MFAHRLGRRVEQVGRWLLRYKQPKETWIDVGAHLGENTFAQAAANPELLVYAFEPNLKLAAKRTGILRNFIVLPFAVSENDGTSNFHINACDAASSLLPFHPEGLGRWITAERLEIERTVTVPTIRLDTFMNQFGIQTVDFLKIDAQGSDFAVLKSAGERLRDVRKICLEVTITEIPLYAGSSGKDQIISYLEGAGFTLVAQEKQSDGQEENLTFLATDIAGRALLGPSSERGWMVGAMSTLAKLLAAKPALAPRPSWILDLNQAKPGPMFRLRDWIWRSSVASFTLPWLQGLQIWCSSRDETLRSVFLTGYFEPNQFVLLDKILKPGIAFIDVGANIGLYALFAARKVGPHGVVIALEPSSREFQKLRANVQLNGLTNVRLLQVGASHIAAERKLLIAVEENAGHNTLGAFGYDTALFSREMVHLERLDDIVRKERLQRVDVLKMDIEGAEWFALQGAVETLQQFHPILFLEVSDRMLKHQGCSGLQIWEFLASLGYKLFAFDGNTGLPVPALREPPFDGENLVAVHPMGAKLWPSAAGSVATRPHQSGAGRAETMEVGRTSR